ncbi:MAG: ParB/RepB/Spo0J family partition protein [bacterium]
MAKRLNISLPQSPSLGKKKVVEEVVIDSIRVGKNARRDLGDLDDLVASIKREGVKQPVLGIKMGRYYRLIFGHRRLEAARRAGLVSIPLIEEEMPPGIESEEDLDNYILELQLLENLNREDLNPLEETEGILTLLNLRMKGVKGFENYGQGAKSVLKAMWNFETDRNHARHDVVPQLREIVEETFEMLPITWQSFLNHRLPLLSMPEDLKEALAGEPNFKPAHAMEIAKVAEPSIRRELVRDVTERGMGLRELKNRVRDYRRKFLELPVKPIRRSEFITFDEIPNIRIKPKKKGFTLDVDTTRGNLVDAFEKLAELARQGRI